MRDVEVCRSRGHGVLDVTEDGCGYDLAYRFDEIGNQLALDYVDVSAKTDNVVVTVTGERDTARTIFVDTLAEELFEFHEGYLVDLWCLQLDSFPIAFDGADLVNSPEDHSIKCMRDVADCRANGYGILQMNDNGTYALAYSFDDIGNQFTLDFVDTTTIEDDVFVRVRGIPGANNVLSEVSFEHIPSTCRPVISTIVDLASSTDSLSTLVTALVTAELTEALSGDGPFTVFAPRNEAFDALPAGTLFYLLEEDTNMLANILLYHVAEGAVLSTDLSDGQSVPTLQGQALDIALPAAGGVVINGNASVVQADVAATNGVVHIIDKVLIPATETLTGFLVDVYCWQLDSFPFAIDGADLVNAPEAHSIHCMRDVAQCRANGFGILVQQQDGTYNLEYAFDDAGNEAILKFLDETTLIDDVRITVTGYPTNGLRTVNALSVAELAAVTVRFHGEVVSHTGYLIDILCWEREGHIAIDGADLDTNPQDHSIHCMRDVEVCRSRGHGVLDVTEDGCGYDLAYRFDEIGNQLALDYVDVSAKTDNVVVTVTGERDTARTIFVDTLAEELFEFHEGYLVDLWCLQLDSFPIAFDGADLVNSPEDHSIKCMRDVADCRANGYGILQMNDNGTYALAYSFDDIGNQFTLDFVDTTTIEDDVFVRVRGIPGANNVLSEVSFEHIPPSCRGGDDVVATPPPTDGSCELFPSDDSDFEYSVELDADLRLYWTIEGDSMRAMMVKQGDGWAALAASVDELMVGSDAVMATGGSAPEKYDVEVYGLPERMADANQTLTATSTELVNGNLVVRWTKLLVESGELPISVVEPQQFIYAHGTSADVSFHFDLADAHLQHLAPVCDPSATPAPTLKPTVSPAPTAAVSCASDDPDYDFGLPLDGSLTFFWRVADDVLVGRLLKEGGGWGGIAASLDELMPGSDGIIGQEGDLTIAKYAMDDRNAPELRGSAQQTLTETSVEVLANGDVDYRFTKILAEAGEIEIKASGANRFIWAHSSSGTQSYHGARDRGALQLDLSNCAFTEIDLVGVQPQAIKIHGMLMIAAWAYLAPMGILFARGKHFALRLGFFKTWLYLHLAFQLAALVCTAIGFAKAWDAIKDSDVRSDHLTFRHPKIGVAAMVGGVAQLLMGAVRPHPPHGDEPKSIARWTFEILHRVVGYGTLVVALVAMLAGTNKALELQHIDQVRTWNVAVIAPIATTAGLGLLLTLYINVLQEGTQEAVPLDKSRTVKETEMA